MGRQKNQPAKLKNTDEDFGFRKPIDYIPIKKRRNKKGKGSSGPCYKIILPSGRNEEFYLGDMLVGSTNNELPESWKSCSISFVSADLQHLVINLDSTSVVVQVIPEHDIIKEIIITKIFAISVSLVEGSVFFKLYFCNLPLPKFNKKVGSCVQTVLTLLGYTPECPEDGDNDVDMSSNCTLTQLYKNIRKTRETHLNLGCADVQDSRLKPQLRPYQADAVRWMLYREKKLEDAQDELHPLYSVIKLKSGLEIYFDKYSGFVDTTKPIVDPSSRGGILADEMGLGKTVEVLACILLHPKPDGAPKPLDLEKTPTVDLVNRKRRILTQKPVSTPQKLKISESCVKPSGRKSEKYIALEMWYNSVLQSAVPKVAPSPPEPALQCICGGADDEGSVTCTECGKMQHGACLGYSTQLGPYICPQCWLSQPQIECKATLIVSPISLRTQWCKEICRHVRGDFKVLQYGGSSVTPVYPTALTSYDVVITTYNVLQTELKLTETEKALSLRHQRRYSAPGSPLTTVKWWRLCLDEAQTVETPTSMVSAMAKKLNAYFRWAVTGTPISKDISDLHGLIDYLQIEPYNDKFTWEQLLFKLYVRGNPEPMLKFLSEVLWRSSKDEIIDQINIPKQTIIEHWLSFSAVEQYFYKCEHQTSREAFSNKVRTYEPDLPLTSLDRSSLKSVLAPLLSLRQVCTYPNSAHTKYLITKKPVKSMKDLLDALIARNVNECEEHLRVILSSLNGLAGIYLLLEAPEQAIEQYREVLQLYTRFTEEEKISKLNVDKLQVVHTMHNLAEILDANPGKFARTLRDENLRKDCADLEQKYIERFINQSMAVLQDVLLISGNIEKLQNSFILAPGKWYSDLLDWIYIHSYEQELHTKIMNLHSDANVKCTVESQSPRTLIYCIATWDENISELRETTIEVVNDLYTHCPDDEFKIIIAQELVQKATDCHLRPQKKSKSRKKCPVCVANDHLKAYELKLFAMSKRTETFVDMSLKGSWKPTPEELIFKSILAVGRSKNADATLLKDGEVHINILETLKKEFKEVRKLWTYLEQQICAQDELDMCKIRLRLKEANEEEKQNKILQNLNYNIVNKLETIHVLDVHEVGYQRTVLHSEENRNKALLEKNLGTRSYLETLRTQQYEDQPPDPCPICKNCLEKQWSILSCGHCYCLECIQLLIDQTKGHHVQCSVCRSYHLTSEISYIKPGEHQTVPESEKIAGNYSTKVESIVRLILKLRLEDEDVKILLFSTWIPVLSYIREALTKNSVTSELITSGNLEKQIEKFKDADQNITVLLLPINLGGKGLNLIEATHVILTEPLLNPGEELQAIGRVHRIGQTRPTVVHKFFIKHTIEESIQKAVSTDAKNWEKNKVTLGQLVDLFVTDDASEEQQNENSDL
ncbi:E3 ubiquitin-protein ligase SHPRH isoform X2 [Tribolium castaneum]|uniref:E3 ubiquitin-protein ligase SHPRH isoform X2 n=1 Tax=Tribolium castaneum TaxID=7070 RepID=UPI00046C0C9D|nr:PREDICTED: E3 ubiquitin-protein ligase SHPRH isoform X2 [Tribolium castaneum]|eukprot:XP_008201431.1 PREDICTED: E3 ubiquitin-protein ligase SHPRH isoform X2 [Tribolium castaneum]